MHSFVKPVVMNDSRYACSAQLRGIWTTASAKALTPVSTVVVMTGSFVTK
jgi:hypothetical protein